MPEKIIGYQQARNLMRQLDWHAREVNQIRNASYAILFHPLQPNRYRLRVDTWEKLRKECILHDGGATRVYVYNRNNPT